MKLKRPLGVGTVLGRSASFVVRTIIRAISVLLGILCISVTLGGKVEYRGIDNPIIGIAVGLGLILTPGGTLIMVLAYFFFVAVIVLGGVVGGALGARFLGTFGVYVGFLIGLGISAWITVVSRMYLLIGAIVAWVDKKE